MTKNAASAVSGFSKERWWQDPLHRGASGYYYAKLSLSPELSRRLEVAFEPPMLNLCLHLGQSLENTSQ